MMQDESFTVSPDGLSRLLALREETIVAVTDRLYTNHGSLYETFGARGRAACKEDIGYHLEFIGAALEFGSTDVLVNYLRWLASVLRSRHIPDEHLALSLDYLVEAIGVRLSEADAAALELVVAKAKGTLLDDAAGATPYIAAMPSAWEECDAFQEALVSGDRLKALEIFRQVITAGRGFVDTEVHLVQPTFYRIGEAWQENKVSVAQEHIATTIAHSILAREFAHAQPEPRVNRKAVLACVEGNHHALGLQMVADAFELQGWEVRNIGANTPTSALVRFVREDDPHLVGLSAAMPHHLPAARGAIARLHSELGEACPPLMLGGYAINQFEPLSTMLGADFTGADARAAAETGSGIMG